MPLIAAKILEGITGGQVNSQQLKLQQALAELIFNRNQDARTQELTLQDQLLRGRQAETFQQEQDLLQQRADISRGSALDSLRFELGLQPGATEQDISAARAEEIQRTQQNEETRSAIAQLQSMLNVGQFFGSIPSRTTATGQRITPVVPNDVEAVLPGTQQVASQIRSVNEAARRAAEAGSQADRARNLITVFKDFKPEEAEAALSFLTVSGQIDTSDPDVVMVLISKMAGITEGDVTTTDASKAYREILSSAHQKAMIEVVGDPEADFTLDLDAAQQEQVIEIQNAMLDQLSGSFRAQFPVVGEPFISRPPSAADFANSARASAVAPTGISLDRATQSIWADIQRRIALGEPVSAIAEEVDLLASQGKQGDDLDAIDWNSIRILLKNR